MFTAGAFDAGQVENFDAIAFGCPAMGAEELEESEFEPMFSACEQKLTGRPTALFGSYGWGDGEWKRRMMQAVPRAAGWEKAWCKTKNCCIA